MSRTIQETVDRWADDFVTLAKQAGVPDEYHNKVKTTVQPFLLTFLTNLLNEFVRTIKRN